jgi:acyl-CoA synthetase (AMP-forming)/AMP-acid ligase II
MSGTISSPTALAGWRVLREDALRHDLAELTACWRTRRPFVLMPAKTAVTDDWLAQALSTLPAQALEGHFAMLTSGSSGDPKLVLCEMARAEALARALQVAQSNADVDAVIVTLPLTYSFAFVNQWVWSEVHGRPLVQTAGLADPVDLRRALLEANRAMLCLVGVQVPLLLQYFAGQVFPGVSRIHFAGGRFPQEQLPALAALFPKAQVYNNYGCAEAMPRLTVRPAAASTDPADVGPALPGIEIRSDDEGALVFRSAYGAVGIVELGRFSPIGADTWVRSGDMAEATPEGHWRLTGRLSEVFKRHGEKISLPTILGTVAAAWPGQFAAYREVDRHGEDGWVLALAPQADDAQVRSILLALRKQHPRAHWPLRIEGHAALPLLSNGKTDLRSLPQHPGAAILWRQPI